MAEPPITALRQGHNNGSFSSASPYNPCGDSLGRRRYHTARQHLRRPAGFARVHAPRPHLQAGPAVGAVDLSWTEVPGAQRYELNTWWEGLDDWQHIGGDNLTDIAFHHPDLTIGVTYYYRIRAIDADGQTSAWSDNVFATVHADLAAPVLNLQPAAGAVNLSWTAVPDAARYDLYFWWEDLDRLAAARRRQPHRHHLRPHRAYRRRHLPLPDAPPQCRRPARPLVAAGLGNRARTSVAHPNAVISAYRPNPDANAVTDDNGDTSRAANTYANAD